MVGQNTLNDTLKTIPIEQRLQVKEVCTDMDTYYINVAKECFANARIVIDHFHLIAWALKKLDDIRRSSQQLAKKSATTGVRQLLMKPSHTLKEDEFKTLEAFFVEYPEVKVAWKCVHQVRRIYWQKNWKEGHSELRKAIWFCEQSGILELQELANTLKKHKENILNYYISKSTNAYTEGVHTRFELLERGHCGIANMERFAKRLMFAFIPFSFIVQNYL